MRVLHVHTTYREPGGEDSVVAAERRLLARAGHEVVPFDAGNPHGAAAALALAASPWNPAAARATSRVVQQARPDVAHVHNLWFALSPSVPAALVRHGVPVVVTLHNYRRVCASSTLFRDGRPCEDCVGRSPLPGVRHRCYRGSYASSAAAAATIALNQQFSLLDRSVSLFLTFNDFAKQRFVRGGLAPERIRLHPNFVDEPGPRPAPPSQSSDVLVVGRVEQLKGVEVLLAAWDRARPPGLELVVVGDGQDRQRLERLGVPRVRFAGALPADEVRRAMLHARALAFPSVLYEGQPMSVLEAMSCSLPVIASRRGGTPELLAEAGPQWLAEPGDVPSWAAALSRLASDPHDADRAGAVLRTRWEREHTPPAALDRLLSAYAEVAS